MSDKTGNPAVIDVVAASIPTMKKHIEFVVNHTKALITLIDSHPAQIGAEGHSCKGTKLHTTPPIPAHLRFAQEAGSD
jgi:tetrahydromethanopterin S-methyltransferase subunit H